MDPRLLRLYSDELSHLREVGAEFAREFPKIAARLGVEGMEVTDPYVERLLEGFAFLTARVQLKLEAEQPRLIAHLLEATYPNFLAPTAVDDGGALRRRSGRPESGSGPRRAARQRADLGNRPRPGHALRIHDGARSDPVADRAGERAVLQLCTGSRRGEAAAAARHARRPAHSAALRRRPSLRPARPRPPVVLHQRAGRRRVSPPRARARRHERHARARRRGRRRGVASAAQWRGSESLRPVGFAADEALLPESLRAFSGYRLLQEVAAMPQRLLFFEIGDLADRLRRVASDEVELVVLLGRGDAALEAVVDAPAWRSSARPRSTCSGSGSTASRSAPARGSTTSSPIAPGRWTTRCTASSRSPASARAAWRSRSSTPLYATYHDETPPADGEAHGYYTVRREPRLLSSRQKQNGARSAYIGEEVFLSLVDPRHAPVSRRRPPALGHGVDDQPRPADPVAGRVGNDGAPAWRLESPGPVGRVDAAARADAAGHAAPGRAARLELRQPPDAQPPRRSSAKRRSTRPRRCATMLGLYAPPEDSGWARQVEGVHGLEVRSVVRRLPFKGPLTFGTRRRDRPRARRARLPGHERVPVRAASSSASSRATPRSTASPSSR